MAIDNTLGSFLLFYIIKPFFLGIQLCLIVWSNITIMYIDYRSQCTVGEWSRLVQATLSWSEFEIHIAQSGVTQPGKKNQKDGEKKGCQNLKLDV